jgi:hypothetical protein
LLDFDIFIFDLAQRRGWENRLLFCASMRNGGTAMDAHWSTETSEAFASFEKADFQLTKIDTGNWRLRILTQRGNAWLRANGPAIDRDELTLSLQAANSFLGRARVNGLCTEYVGPFGRSLL